MSGFTQTPDGIVIRGSHVQQLTDWLTGQKKDAPGTIVCTSSTQYALTVTSEDTTNGYIFRCLDSTGGTQFAVTQTGVALGTVSGTFQGRLRDKNGYVVNLEAYTTATINTGTADTDTAWLGAIAECTASQTGKASIVLGPGTFLGGSSSVTIPNGITIRGAGRGATVIKHRDGSAREPIYAFNKTGVSVMDLTVDGNRLNNNNATSGFDGYEIAVDGTTNSVVRCTVTNFNKMAIGIAGQSNLVSDVILEGPSIAIGSYDPATSTKNYGGLIGVYTYGGFLGGTRDLIVHNVWANGLRSAGVFVGGRRITLSNVHTRDCHRRDWAGFPGGQIVVATDSADGGTTGTVASEFVSMINCHVGPTTAGTWSSGFEINGCTSVQMIGCTVDNVPAFGLAMADCARVTWRGGSISNCPGTAIAITQTSTAASGIVIDGALLYNNATAVSVYTSTNSFALFNSVFSGNTTNLLNTMTSTEWLTHNNIVISGQEIPNRAIFNTTGSAVFAETIVNANAAGSVLAVQASGSSAGIFALHVFNGSGAIFDVFGHGQASMHSSTDTVLIADTSITSAAIRSVFQIQEATVTKARIGMDASDNLAVVDSAGTTALLVVDTQATSTTLGQVTVQSSSTANTVGLRIGRTNATEARLLIAATTNSVLTGSTAGDVVLAAQTSLLFGANAAATARFDAAKNKILHDGIGGSTGPLLVTSTAGFVWIPYINGTPTGNPGSPLGSAGSTPVVVNLSANTMHFWTGAAWRTVTSS